ncbi:MAG: hypothetical protein ACNS60_12075 [Candidatus Cyclobacteriaceae bacterium M2_1C_046]
MEITKNMVTVIKKGTPIDKMKKLLNEAFSKTPKKNIRKYAGVLQTDIDPLDYQKQMRNEWK